MDTRIVTRAYHKRRVIVLRKPDHFAVPNKMPARAWIIDASHPQPLCASDETGGVTLASRTV